MAAATQTPTRLVRLIRRPTPGLPGVLRLSRPRAGTATDYRVEEVGYSEGRVFKLEPLLASEYDPAETVWVVLCHRGGDYTLPESGDAGELLQAVRLLVESGKL